MKNLNIKLIPITTIILPVIVMLMLSSSTAGQSGNRNQTPPVAGSPKPGDELRPASIRARQFKMMELEKEASQPLSPEERELAVAHIADDYKHIQIINNKMMAATMRAASPDYRSIAQTLAEIRKRALRLKHNLGLSKLEMAEGEKAKHKQALNAADVKSQIVSLDRFIMSFVENPIFKNPDVVNVQEATKARRDLEFIIENSQLISKDAERLSKSSAKTP